MQSVINDFLNNFKLSTYRESYQSTIKTITDGVVFKGTNLWILVFAIFIASLGLNVNSTAVIIGAMLISPLMGPIIGIGLAMATNDVHLLRKAARNYVFAVVISLVTSSFYFLISPLNQAHSEILARTNPNIYDVLIAFIGGLAGIIAIASRFKGNVLPGVAIATALMPPLCTAGYGVSTFQMKYFFGAFYLFLINSVFIAFATFLGVRFLRFPLRSQPDEESRLKARRVIWFVILLTVVPSAYLGYEIIVQTRFLQNAEKFIENEAVIPGDYLLNKSIDSRNRKISLVFGGNRIEDGKRTELKNRLRLYDLNNTELEIKQGFSVSNANSEKITLAAQKQASIQFSRQIYHELLAQGIPLISIGLEESSEIGNSPDPSTIWLVSIRSAEHINSELRKRIHKWLRVRLNSDNIAISFHS